jgi:hypothetical protein
MLFTFYLCNCLCFFVLFFFFSDYSDGLEIQLIVHYCVAVVV